MMHSEDQRVMLNLVAATLGLFEERDGETNAELAKVFANQLLEDLKGNVAHVERGRAMMSDRMLIAIGPNVFGYGETRDEAYKNLQLQGGRKSNSMLVNAPIGSEVASYDGRVMVPNAAKLLGLDGAVVIERNGRPVKVVDPKPGRVETGNMLPVNP